MIRSDAGARPPSAGLPLGGLAARIFGKYSDVVVILAPPRSASTALARVFWGHSEIAFYAHEPFDLVHYEGEDPAQALRRIEAGLDLAAELGVPPPAGRGLLVKDMVFQVEGHFPLLVTLATRPIVFLIRDPRLSIASRMERLRRRDGSLEFPLDETGWLQLPEQVAWCRRFHVPHVIVDATEFRLAPASVLSRLFDRLGLTFSEELLSWSPIERATLGNLRGRQDGWYDRVLLSTGVAPPDERVRDFTVFEEVPGLRAHVEQAYSIYRSLLETREAPGRGGDVFSAPAGAACPPVSEIIELEEEILHE